MRGLTGHDEEGPWSDSGEGTANRPPTRSNVQQYGDFQDTWNARYAGNMEQDRLFSDPDGDALTYSASSKYPGVVKTWVEDVTWYATIINPATSEVTYGASDAYGGYASSGLTITGTANETRSVPENSPAGTNVGAPVAGIPYGEETLTHTLSGEAATSGAFEIEASTGQITVKTGATLDYETRSSYTGTVTWTVQGQTATANLTINVTDLEAGKPAAPTLTRTPFDEPTDPALDAAWTAPAVPDGLTLTGYEFRHRKKGAAEWTHRASALMSDGTLVPALSATTTSLHLPGLEAGAVYEAQVRAVTAEEEQGPWSDTGEGRANRPPTLGDEIAIDYRMEWGQSSAAVAASKFYKDADGDDLTYSITSQYPGIIQAVIEGTENMRTKALNPGVSRITQGARDPYGGHVSRTITITGFANETRSIAENSPAGTSVGRAVAGTPYSEESLTHVLAGEATSAFEIDPSTGQITVKTGVTLDYETKKSYTGTVTWTVQGQTATANLTINVTDIVAGKPAAPTLTRTLFDKVENPALDVAWTAPAVPAGLTLTGYELRYRKKDDASTPWTAYTHTPEGVEAENGDQHAASGGDRRHTAGPGGRGDLRGPGAGADRRGRRQRLVRLRRGPRQQPAHPQRQ